MKRWLRLRHEALKLIPLNPNPCLQLTTHWPARSSVVVSFMIQHIYERNEHARVLVWRKMPLKNLLNFSKVYQFIPGKGKATTCSSNEALFVYTSTSTNTQFDLYASNEIGSRQEWHIVTVGKESLMNIYRSELKMKIVFEFLDLAAWYLQEYSDQNAWK